MSNQPVPFLDLVTPHRELEEELVEAFRQALRSAAFVGGPQVEAFEREFAEFCGVKYCVGVANGTDAVRFALDGVRRGAGRRGGDRAATRSSRRSRRSARPAPARSSWTSTSAPTA